MDENEIREEGATGEGEEQEEGEENETGETGASENNEGEEQEEGEEVAIDVAQYKITGLVDTFDEQMNITGQFPIGSVQELPVEYGDRMVAQGSAQRVTGEEE